MSTNSYGIRKKAKVILTHVVLGIVCLAVVTPVLFALVKSTQTSTEIFSYPPKLLLGTAGFTNYITAWKDVNLGRLMLNTGFIALIVIAGKIAFSLFAALALVYFDFRFKNILFFFILLTIMLPVAVRIIPLYQLIRNLNWGNSYYALTVPFLASATALFLFRQHFMSVPNSIVDAARVDGASPLRFLWSILLPMSMNIIGGLVVIEFVYMWNQYLWPLIILTTEKRKVVQLGMAELIQRGTAEGMMSWGSSMAGAMIVLLPPLIIVLILQEQFLRGIAFSQQK